MYAIIETGGKQIKVTEGETIFLQKLTGEAEDLVVFDRVLVLSGDEGVTFGKPLVEGAKVTGKILSHGKDKKIIVFKYKAKKGYRRKKGHRQPHTKVLIEKIEG